MNVSFIVPASLDKVTGPRNSVTLLAQSVKPLVKKVNVFTSVRCKQFTFNNVPVKPVDNSKLLQSDIVVFSGIWLSEYIKIAALLRKNNIPYVISPRSSLMKSSIKKGLIKKFLFYTFQAKNYIKGAKGIHFLTEDEKSNSFLSSKGFVVGNIVNDKNIIENNLEQKKEKSDSKIISFLGRLDIQHKGLDILFSAIAIAANELRENKVEIRVFGPDQFNCLKKLESILESNNIKDLVSLGGKLEGIEKANFLYESDFFVHTSRYEGQPQAVMEAMMCGCGILVTPGTNMISITNQSNAGLVALLDAKDIAEKLVELIKLDKVTLSKNAFAYAEKYFLERYIGNAFFKHLNQIIKESN